MRIYLHIGLEHAGVERLQKVLADKREQLRGKGVLFPRAPGGKNHTRLFMAVTDPDHVDPLRFNRGFATAEQQEELYQRLGEDLQKEVAAARPETLILSASQLGAKLHRKSELERLRKLLLPLSQDIRVIAHVADPVEALAQNYAGQILDGRDRDLRQELALVEAQDWWQACLETLPAIDPLAGQFEETQAAAFWLDYTALETHWNAVFGPDTLRFRPYDAARFYSEDAPEEIYEAFALPSRIGRIPSAEIPAPPSAIWLARCRQLNQLLLQLLKREQKILPRQLWRSFHREIHHPGAPLDRQMLSPIGAPHALPRKS